MTTTTTITMTSNPLKKLRPLYRLIAKRLAHEKSRNSAREPPSCHGLPMLRHVTTIEPRPSHTHRHRSSTTSVVKVAVLRQACSTPITNGVTKPAKCDCYEDSSVDIAHALARASDPTITVLTPVPDPDPANEDGWTFPDTPEGLHAALEQGATHIWANVHCFAGHPLQTLRALDKFEGSVKVVRQPPCLGEWADDKSSMSGHLHRRHRELGVRLPETVVVSRAKGTTEHVEKQLERAVNQLGLPVVAKPPRGRGSGGVQKCTSVEELQAHTSKLLQDDRCIIVEEYMPGEEGSVTVIPPTSDGLSGKYRTLPLVENIGHADGIIADSGRTSLHTTSRAKRSEEIVAGEALNDATNQCEVVARAIEAVDINLEPNRNGPWRPARETHLNLICMSAEQIGWNYEDFLKACLDAAIPLGDLRRTSTYGKKEL